MAEGAAHLPQAQTIYAFNHLVAFQLANTCRVDISWLPLPAKFSWSTTVGRRLLFLDGLRAIAAVSVLIQHMFERTVLNEGFKIVLPGLFGVVLFFFISGFIIPYSVGSTFNPDKFAIIPALIDQNP
jgi:hypothetical protein